MKTFSTLNTLRLPRILSTLAVIVLIACTQSIAQKWSGANGNEWLAGRYSQPWVRIGVTAKGIHKVNVSDLPQVFKDADKNRLELWHRGVQVSIIKADANEILFYGVPNDGAMDALLFRLPTARKNPYYSIYSDESSYFLTVNPSANGDRAIVATPLSNPSPEAVASHVKTDVRIYKNEYTHSSSTYYRPSTYNSYFEEGKQYSGTSLMGFFLGNNIQVQNPKSSIIFPSSYVPEPFSFQIKFPVGAATKKMSVHLKARLGASTAEVFIGKTAATLRSLGTLSVSELNDYDFNFDLQDSDFDANGVGTLGFRTTQVGYEGSGYSVSFFKLTYDQALNMQSLNSYEFELPAVGAGIQSSLAITNTPAGVQFYDITTPDVPRIIPGTPSSLLIDRNGQKINLLATNQVTTVLPAKITTTTFTEINPANFDYLIVCSNTLTSSANQYAAYRKDNSPGKKYKPLVISIRDVYNQFNYGEPSAVAIRRFTDYMISDGQKDSKYLLLLGRSNTFPERMTREIPDEVPTVGYPGSDMLLTDGLAGSPDDVPAVPVGRVAAISDQQVLDYLAKVQKYESQDVIAWRKNVIHMNGGKTDGEITQFSNYLNSIATDISSNPFSGNVIPKLKTVASDDVIEMNFATELNGAGVGMVTYFGHGGVDKTDYNAGYVSDPNKGYNNPNNFPVLFYNGCGVNNIFSGRNGLFGTTPASSVRPMSLDWLLTPNKGAVIVFGNTWDAFASTSNEYLDKLYTQIFTVTDINRKTIGNIVKEVARLTKQQKNYTYNVAQNSRVASYYDADRANVHQVLLQGDPALNILITDGALPVDLISFTAKTENEKVRVEWLTASEKNNSHFIVERSYNGKLFEEIGRVEGKGTTETETSYLFYDSKPLTGVSYYRLKQVDYSKVVDGKTVDGKSSYSTIVPVRREESKFFVVSPNPIADAGEFKVDVPVKIKSWNLVNVAGQTVLKNQTGNKLNLSQLTAGDYVLEVYTENGDVYHKKVVKK
ncbi:Por secretion system C-terminal sorting domain-containing protein [Dyadobacter soli]|uniref:Por secretion system C-terminal sorting domain-containing protein n=1 Tax=Dyadobacter soli TaxID=659014 RepID=A0A1G7ZXT8_9BACT|nr:C25 family cysteine peptidase [Dyadobacter soli]SDH13472.1 Por secretion system C-terminal sorting domain-containing protein [Dyadobacter soli]